MQSGGTMKPPITLIQEDEYNQPYSTFDYWMGKAIDMFAAIGMVAVAGAAVVLLLWRQT